MLKGVWLHETTHLVGSSTETEGVTGRLAAVDVVHLN